MHALGIRDLTPLWLCANDNFKNRQSPLEHLVLLFINIGSPMKREAWSLLASLASILLRKKLTAGGAAFLPIAPTRLQPRHGLLQSHRRPQPRVERLVAHLVDRRVRGAPPPVQRRAVVRREVARGVVPALCLRLIHPLDDGEVSLESLQRGEDRHLRGNGSEDVSGEVVVREAGGRVEQCGGGGSAARGSGSSPCAVAAARATAMGRSCSSRTRKVCSHPARPPGLPP